MFNFVGQVLPTTTFIENVDKLCHDAIKEGTQIKFKQSINFPVKSKSEAIFNLLKKKNELETVKIVSSDRSYCLVVAAKPATKFIDSSMELTIVHIYPETNRFAFTCKDVQGNIISVSCFFGKNLIIDKKGVVIGDRIHDPKMDEFMRIFTISD